MVRVIVLALIALGWWLAAPDRFTAAARTATGQAARAAGSAARGQWVADRGGRQAVRTDRRDRWQRRGENTAGRRFRAWLWRRALGTERALVAAGRASLSGGRLARAAVSPVPGEARDGWRKGQDRHRARTAGRPVPVALDPPWWRRPVPAPVPQDSAGQDGGTAVEDSPGTAPAVTTIPGNRRYEPDPYKTVLTRQPNGNVRAEVFYTGAPEHGEQSIWDDEFLSPEAARIGAAALIQEVQADHGKKAPATVSWVDRTVTAVPPEPLYGTSPSDDSLAKGSPVRAWRHIPFEYVDDNEPPTPADTPGGTMSAPTELRTHVAVQDFAQEIARLSESSDFVVVAEKARTVGAQSRAGGFGGEMDLATDSLEETARRFAASVDALREQAAAYGKTSLSVQGS